MLAALLDFLPKRLEEILVVAAFLDRLGAIQAHFGDTDAGEALGPRVSGLSASYPIIGGAIAAFAHAVRGPRAGVAALRGMASALFGFIAFFGVIGYGLGPLAPLPAYGLALAMALATQGLTLLWLRGDARRAARVGG